MERVLEIVRGNLTTLADVPHELDYLLDPIADGDFEPEALEMLARPNAPAVCRAFAEGLEQLAVWSADAIKSALQRVGTELGVKGRELFQPVRAALTGRTHGPELPVLAEFLQRERCVERLRQAAAKGEANG